ncbi:eCIS core domain-containing protein [Sediminispirochaeta bajacaliforniensis]|uniref:eCIS core domain-containing protein n=1 Tax=Sediminispirochaeta bajacaliforniensis TaxID=148 RepID=UPI00037F47F6|nr:DUF4157 domain-containing protein [Sediminispirochaeta bajacaliforniensis]
MGETEKYRNVINRAIASYQRFLERVESGLRPKTVIPVDRSRPLPLLNEYAAEYEGYDNALGLDATLKEQFERAFGADFSKVKIHTGHYANELTRNARAEAVTIGNDIYFAGGLYAPDTEQGIALLGHELQHVLQNQKKDRMVYLEDVALAEYEAEVVEELLGNLRMHNISAALLHDEADPRVGGAEEGQAAAEAAETSGVSSEAGKGDVSFSDFRGRNERAMLKYHMSTGETLELSLEEYEQGKDLIMAGLEEELREKKMVLPRKAYEEKVLRFLEYMKEG